MPLVLNGVAAFSYSPTPIWIWHFCFINRVLLQQELAPLYYTILFIIFYILAYVNDLFRKGKVRRYWLLLSFFQTIAALKTWPLEKVFLADNAFLYQIDFQSCYSDRCFKNIQPKRSKCLKFFSKIKNHSQTRNQTSVLVASVCCVWVTLFSCHSLPSYS